MPRPGVKAGSAGLRGTNKKIFPFREVQACRRELHLWHLAFIKDGLMKSFLPWILSFIAAVSMTMGCQRSRAGMTVAGSTSVEPFAELLAEEYMSEHPKAHIYVQGGGSTAGIEAAISGAAHIGMSSRNLIDAEKKLYAVTIAKDAIAVIVHPSNRIEDLPLDKIREDFLRKDGELEKSGRPRPSH